MLHHLVIAGDRGEDAFFDRDRGGVRVAAVERGEQGVFEDEISAHVCTSLLSVGAGNRPKTCGTQSILVCSILARSRARTQLSPGNVHSSNRVPGRPTGTPAMVPVSGYQQH
jgi:hypothetical protein